MNFNYDRYSRETLADAMRKRGRKQQNIQPIKRR